ncbi:MAG: hypothetical protein ABIU06_08420 [Anaerolineales bacterium]
MHGLHLHGMTNDTTIKARWSEAFASLAGASGSPDLTIRLDLTDHVPPVPVQKADFTQGDLLRYYLDGHCVTAHFPRYGHLILDLEAGTTEGAIIQTALDQYGVFEDLLAISLSPHFRRRGLFLIHAFAATYNRQGILLVGGIGAGKTTTGMSLLNAGWRLLSNDSPILNESGEVLQYPGLLAGYPDTFMRFETTRGLVSPAWDPAQKICVPPTQFWPEVWQESAPVQAILFPRIEGRTGHALEALSAPDALLRLLPNAVEQWDRAMIPQHLLVLRKLVEHAPAYLLHLGPEVLDIPPFLEKELFS